MTDEDVRKAVRELRSLHADMLYSQRSPGMWAASSRILEIAADLDAALAIAAPKWREAK